MVDTLADICNSLPHSMAIFFMRFMPEEVAKRAYEKLWESCAKSDGYITYAASDGSIWLEAKDTHQVWKEGPISLELPAKRATRIQYPTKG